MPGYNHNNGLVLENAEGKTVRQLIKELGIPSEEVYTIMVNYLPSQPRHVVKDGDFVTLSKVMGAG